MIHVATDNGQTTVPVDDCWNRIGSRGDGSCPRLVEYARCLNCPVFERGAALLLDRPLDNSPGLPHASYPSAQAASSASREHAARALAAHDLADVDRASLEAALVFRVADEWLALPAAALRQVDEPRPIHSLPHRRNRVVLGLVNIRGALTVAASLGELLNLDRNGPARHASRTVYARMLVATHRGEPAAFPVDEVEGIVRFATSTVMPVPTTFAHATASHARGVLAWRDTTIGLLDTARVFDSLARNLR
ncbi:chemotaxis protein CheW [Paraburkholderia megapolitana]|uniref:Chemotaxis protein CheW n=1 Tax=Paraburkholderia megapolitana TaxID=420953 RepID=A0A1I3LJL6_9BURK|nr:chemotaxis protein CheW [Paraburkholderia megapolitana]QDQ80747.1 purine-binding chemotaxis protein CheW [Paraburkholderia megapolitana]SFI84989.1 chemotaxis-related protein WspD [Paraburkholderia megapolitana]